MSKEKNVQKQESAPKKENLSVLERIRRRTGLLVGIVGLALVIFILESLLGSSNAIFGGQDRVVGFINGHKVDIVDFTNRLELKLNEYRQSQRGEIDDNVRGQAVENVWQSYVVEYAVRPEFKKAGIDVGEDELYDRVVLNPVQYVIRRISTREGQIDPQFAAADGSLDRMKWKQAVQTVSGESEKAVKQIEEEVKNTRLFEKFRMLVNKGLYLTTAEVKAKSSDQNSSIDISYVLKRYDAIDDKSIKLTDEDIQKYYTENSYKYKNRENTRAIEYVAFNVVPSPADLAAIEADANRIAGDLKGKTPAEDSAIMGQEGDQINNNIQSMTRKNMTIRDSSIYTSAPGAIFGPYNEGLYFKIYKLQAINKVADSARVRHILVGIGDRQQPKRSMPQAKKEADSLLVLIKDKKVSFDSLVVNYSDDPGSKTNGGDYGWFDETDGFVEPFKNAGLMGTKGNISVVETQFGYHIIEVLDVSKASHTSYRVAQVFIPVQPSEETNQRVFAQASEFAGVNNTAELFDKGAESQKLTKRLADNIRDVDRMLPGLDRARDLVKWVYDPKTKMGDVAVFSFKDKHVVAKLSGIKNKGIAPLETVKDEITKEAIKQKKSEMMMEEFKNKGGNAPNIDALASKLGLQSFTSENLIPETHDVKGVGRDDIMIGTALGLKQGAMSRPVAGETGVFVLSVTKTVPAAPLNDYSDKRKQFESQISARTDYDSFNAIKEAADIEDFKGKID